MTAGAEVRVGVIGLGMMGKAHLAAYEAARRAGVRCRVVAVCDRRDDAGPIPAGAVRVTTAEALFSSAVDLVSICTRTDSHVALARAALDAGARVLVEKPVALTEAALAPLLASPATSRCMPAHCMRFWPGWDLVHDAVRSGAHGRVRSATFQRLASAPDWSREFYGNPALSGGALVDLHVHDADFIRWCFGDPVLVSSSGTPDHVTTSYRYGDTGPARVVASASWNRPPGSGFVMRYVVECEGATLDFDLGRDPRLVIARAGRTEAVAIPDGAGYEPMVRHALALAGAAAPSPVVTLDDARGVARLLDAERTSLESGQPVAIRR